MAQFLVKSEVVPFNRLSVCQTFRKCEIRTSLILSTGTSSFQISCHVIGKITAFGQH